LPWLSTTYFKLLFIIIIIIIIIIITAKPWQQQQWKRLVRKWSPRWLPWCSVLLIGSSKKCNFEPSNCNVCALHTPAEDAIWWNRDTSGQDKLAIETALQQQQQQQQRCKPLSEWVSFAGMVCKLPYSRTVKPCGTIFIWCLTLFSFQPRKAPSNRSCVVELFWLLLMQ
jgi:hypothetical protein